jgi:hypothetical protein
LVIITAGVNEKTGGATDRTTLRAGYGCLKQMPRFTRASFRNFKQWRRRRSCSSSPILPTRLPMWFAY